MSFYLFIFSKKAYQFRGKRFIASKRVSQPFVVSDKHCKFFYFYFAANCLDPGVPYQGKTIDQDFRHGRTVRFTCPRNYTIEGVAAIKCTDGQWNNNKPSCKGKRTSVTLLEKQTNIHNKTNQAHQKAFASAIERKKLS